MVISLPLYITTRPRNRTLRMYEKEVKQCPNVHRDLLLIPKTGWKKVYPSMGEWLKTTSSGI